MSKKKLNTIKSENQVKMYRLKISLIGYHQQPIRELHRIIDVAENTPFAVLHDYIFMAFDRFDEHLYKFYLTRKEVKNPHQLYDCNETVLMAEDMMYERAGSDVNDADVFTIGEADLQEKEFMYYWFDYGDDWVHRIRVEKIFYIEDEDPTGDGYYIDIRKKVGESPAQYDDDSVWNTDNEEAMAQQIMMVLVGMVMPDMPQQMLVGDLKVVNIFDTMLESKLIEPPKDPNDYDEKVKLTEQGELKGQMMLALMDKLPELAESGELDKLTVNGELNVDALDELFNGDLLK